MLSPLVAALVDVLAWFIFSPKTKAPIARGNSVFALSNYGPKELQYLQQTCQEFEAEFKDELESELKKYIGYVANPIKSIGPFVAISENSTHRFLFAYRKYACPRKEVSTLLLGSCHRAEVRFRVSAHVCEARRIRHVR